MRKLIGAARVYRFDAGEAHFQADEVSLADVHRDESQTRQQKRQHEGKVVVVVHRAEQHGKRHDAVHEADAGRQDVDTTSGQRRVPCVEPLTLPRPPLRGAGLGGGRRRPYGMATESRT